MKKTMFIFRLLSISFILLMSCSENQKDTVMEDPDSKADLDILQSWQGDYPVNQLNLLPEGQRDQNAGYIGDSESFIKVWNQFKPNSDVPDIDFGNHLVLFARNIQYYNRISIGKVTLTAGVVDILAMETMSALPIEENVALSLVVVQREGITAIQIGNHKIFVK